MTAPMRVLLLSSAFNSLTQRVFVELTDRGHDVGVSVVSDGDQMRLAVDSFKPELIVAPFLKRAIPDDIWQRYVCLIVHPGIRGDRGPSSLDWAILRGASQWGVTILQADREFDAGDIWSHREFPLRAAGKSAIYRHEVADAAVDGLLEALERVASRTWRPEVLDYGNPEITGRLERPMKQADRAIDWSAPTTEVLRRLRCADSAPGVLDSLFGDPYYIFGGHEEELASGRPGEILGYRDGAICRATGDGAVWITHLKRPTTEDQQFVKLPATVVLDDRLTHLADLGLRVDETVEGRTYREIWYEESNQVGHLRFDFYNGAMSSEQCERLRAAYQFARRRSTRVIVLRGGRDLWSNGIHLNVIESARCPQTESWTNINAINDLVQEIIATDSHVVLSALTGNAGAGGVTLALAADEVYARHGVVLNPHYKGMGLFGSEYWTYLLPRRVGESRAQHLTEMCLPVSARSAEAIGLVDRVFVGDSGDFDRQVRQAAEQRAVEAELAQRLHQKRTTRHSDEHVRPLERYRDEELSRMRRDFAGARYHRARKAFVYKTSAERFTHPAAEGSIIHSRWARAS